MEGIIESGPYKGEPYSPQFYACCFVDRFLTIQRFYEAASLSVCCQALSACYIIGFYLQHSEFTNHPSVHVPTAPLLFLFFLNLSEI